MKLGPDPKQLRDYLGSLVPAAVLTWALAVLTASYLGIATKVDAAFISSLVTSVLAVYGISRKEADKKEPTPSKTKAVLSGGIRQLISAAWLYQRPLPRFQ
jgi:hypothetical protein